MNSDDPTFRLVASDDAKVMQMVGRIDNQVHSAGVVHLNSNTYLYSGSSPEEKFDVAKRYLDGGAGREAAAMIVEVTAHLRSSKVAYYLQLALLANRPFDHLELEDFRKLQDARRMAAEGPLDRWAEAVSVVDELLQCWIDQREADFDADRFDGVVDRFERLAADMREELTRHLSLLLSGAVQDRLDAERCDQIERGRMAGDRRRRVPLFFEPDPLPPRTREAQPPDRGLALWSQLVLGVFVLLTGVVGLVIGVAATNLLTAVVMVALWTGSGLALGWCGPRSLATRAADRRRRDPFPMFFGFVSTAPSAGSDPDHVPPRDLKDLVLARLIELTPRDPAKRDRFGALVVAAEAGLLPVLHHLYVRSDQDPVSPPRINWLVRWHVRRVVAAWESGELRAARAPVGVSWRVRLALVAAVLAAAAGGCLGLLAAVRADRPPVVVLAVSAVLLGAGCWLILRAAPLHTEKQRYRAEQRANAALHQLELAAYEDERERLSERPTDPEMARWLDYDKDNIRIEAMRTWKLTNRDVIMHVVLTEQVDPSISACVPSGPRRFSRYLVRLFLLTSNGVRQLNVEVDFASGARNKEQRFAFRYDAIASLQITEPTVGRHGRRQVATGRGSGHNGNQVRPVLRQALELTLFNGDPIGINADYEPLMAEGRKDQAALAKLEQETTGAVNTLRTLESVAGEGKEWIMRERERSRRTIADYESVRHGTPRERDVHADVGPVSPLLLAGWEKSSSWGYDALEQTLYADLVRNDQDVDGRAIRLPGDAAPVSSEDDLARQIADRTGLPLFQVRAALVRYG